MIKISSTLRINMIKIEQELYLKENIAIDIMQNRVIVYYKDKNVTYQVDNSTNCLNKIDLKEHINQSALFFESIKNPANEKIPVKEIAGYTCEGLKKMSTNSIGFCVELQMYKTYIDKLSDTCYHDYIELNGSNIIRMFDPLTSNELIMGFDLFIMDKTGKYINQKYEVQSIERSFALPEELVPFLEYSIDVE